MAVQPDRGVAVLANRVEGLEALDIVFVECRGAPFESLEDGVLDRVALGVFGRQRRHLDDLARSRISEGHRLL